MISYKPPNSFLHFLVSFSIFTFCSTVSIPNFDFTSVTLDPKKTGFMISGNTGSDWFGFSVKTAGDINMDGYADFLIGAPQKNSNQGMVYVIYGSPTNSFGNIDFSTTTTLNPATTGFTIKGNAAGDQLGISVSTAGDINQDGRDDIIIGAGGKNTAYVIYGKSSYTANIDLSTNLDPATTGFMIKGITLGDQFGYSVSNAGDINKDGYPDMVIGAYLQDSARGSVYVIYGKPSYTSNFDLSANPLIPTSTGFTITGNLAGDHFGFSVSGAGDMNKDTIDDIVIGADFKDNYRGYVYVVYGKANPVDVDLSGSTVLNPSTTGLLASGENLGDHFGFSVSRAGDVNNDGYADILAGAWGINSAAGAAYVIYGGPTLANRVLQTTPLAPASTGFKISGAAVGDHLGSAVSTAGDMNGDGYSDILIGADWFNFQQGAAYVIYGKATPGHVVLGTTPLDPDTTGFTLKGAGANNNLGFGVGIAGDINGDGYSDILVGAYKKNSETGAVYVIHAGCMTANCVSCANKVCQTCDSGLPYYLDLSFSCVTGCPAKTFISNGKCQACLTNCQVCSTSATCTTCTSPYLLYQSSSCGATCPATTYDNSNGVCSACPGGCDTCTSGTVCSVCSSTYFLDQALSSCTQNCPTKTYGLTSTKKCEACPSNCDICTDSNTCTSCTSPYFLDQSLSSCGQNCPTRFFGSTATGKCEACSANCLTCTSATSCQSCDQKYAVVNNACEHCPDNCDACTSSTSCFDCTSPYLLYQVWCLTSCPNGTFPETTTKKCESCPKHCAICTSFDACQTCDPDYVPANASSCVIPPTPTYPKAEAAASKAIQSSVTAAGSLVCVGSVTFPQTTIVSKIVQNMRYINLTVTDELAQVYATWSTNMVPWDFPYFLGSLDNFREAPILFSRYDLDSPFLTNFWSTLTTFGLSAGAFLGFVLLKILAEQAGLKNSCIHTLLQRLVLGSFNFALVQIYGCLDDIVFYLVLDIRGNPLNSAYDWASIICASGFMTVGSLLVYSNFQMARKYQRVKIEGQAKKDPNAIEDFNEKNKYWELFYGDFYDTDIWSQMTLAFIVVRSGFSSFIIAVLYAYPLLQTLSLITLDLLMMLFLIKKNPFITLRGKLTQYYFEAITFLVHLVGFILSLQGTKEKFPEALLMALCSSIIYLNMGLTMGSVGFMFIELYKVISEKVRAKRKLEKKSETIAIQANLDNPDDDNDIQIFDMMTSTERGSPQKSRTGWMKKQQVFPQENSQFLPGVSEESNMTFTGINLLPSNTIAEDSILPDADRSYEQRGQSVMNVRDRRKNIKKKQPKDPLKY